MQLKRLFDLLSVENVNECLTKSVTLNMRFSDGSS